MKRIFITGSSDGLGLLAARALIADGHEVILHARSHERAAVISDLAPHVRGIVIGDLGGDVETRDVAEQVNRLGRMDAVIHNAGIYHSPDRGITPEGHARTLAVNILAPYMLTALIERPQRLVYISSDLHMGGKDDLSDIDWTRRTWNAGAAYADSKLYLTALALALARHWADVYSNAVHPGWVPTKMGGANATDDLTMGYLTQTWLATSDDPAAKVSGGYWHHRKRQQPATSAADPGFQDRLTALLAELTGLSLF